MDKATKNKGRQAKPAAPPARKKNAFTPLLLAGVLAIVLLAFFPVLKNGFTNWDDPGYILDNALIRKLSPENLRTIFSTQVMGNYHPFTMLSLALDYKMHGLDPTGYHLTSLLFHLASTALLFFIVLRLTTSPVAAAITALLFGIHPMHVESVAWVAERKDAGYVFFYFASLLFFLKFRQEKKKALYYALTLLAFGCALMFKGLAVTFPVIMLLTDLYNGRKLRDSWKATIPFFLLSACFGVAAIIAQKNSESIQDISMYPFFDRILFACYALVDYLAKLFFPVGLSAFYPYPEKTGSLYPWIVYLSPLVIAALGFALYKARRSKDILYGFGFFLVNIFLVLQLLPVGNAVMADRYSYLAYTGIFFILGVILQKVFFGAGARLKKYAFVAGIVAGGWMAWLTVTANARTQTWHDSGRLFTDVVSKYPRVPLAFNNLGSYYQKQELLDKALVNFNQAIALQPDFPDALVNRSDIFRVNNMPDSAIHDCTRAIALKPGLSAAYMNRGIAYSIAGKTDSALHDFNEVLRLEPENARAYGNRGNLYDMKGFPDSAIADYNRSVSLDPSYKDVYGNRARSLLKKGRTDDAISDLKTAISLSPYNPEHYFLLAVAYQEKKEWKLALEQVNQAKALGKNVDPAAIAFLKQMAEEKSK